MAIATWLWELLVFLIGGMCGFLLLQFLSRKKEAELEKQIAHQQAMLNEYQDKVQQHFMTTATLVNHMTASYQAVYTHLVSGAKSLCKESEKPRYDRLETQETRETNNHLETID